MSNLVASCADWNSDLWMLRHYYNLESGTFMTIWWEQLVSLHLKLLTWTKYGPPLSVLFLLPITCIHFQYIRCLYFERLQAKSTLMDKSPLKLNEECIYFENWVGE